MLISFVLTKACFKKTYFQIKFELQKGTQNHTMGQLGLQRIIPLILLVRAYSTLA